jgi:hypothetical protein
MSPNLRGLMPPRRRRRCAWARPLKGVFEIDLEHCPQYGGDLKILAANEDLAVIEKMV